MGRKHSSERAKTTGSLEVANKTDDDHRGGLEDGDGLNNLLLVDLGSGLVRLTHDVSHTSLVGKEGSEVGAVRGVVLGEGSDAATVLGGALAGKESQRTTTGGFELSVRHIY
jgi:hypothetical protein